MGFVEYKKIMAKVTHFLIPEEADSVKCLRNEGLTTAYFYSIN